MEDDFEKRLSGMLRYRTEPTTQISTEAVAAGARRARTRTFGVLGSALAVAAVGVGVATVAGTGTGGAKTPVSAAAVGTPATASSTSAAPSKTAPTTSASTTASTTAAPASSTSAPAVSPVKNLAPGEKIEVTPGVELAVTSHTICRWESAAFQGAPAGYPEQKDCKDVTDPNMAFDGSTMNIGLQGAGNKTAYVVSGEFQGTQVPALIDVVYQGKHHTATILRTNGMSIWSAYYAVFPSDVRPVTPNSTPDMPIATAYDAAGHVLATMPQPHTVQTTTGN